MTSKCIKNELDLSTLNLRGLSELSLPPSVGGLIKTLSEEDCEIYLVGGFVRDMVLGVISYDLDFTVVGSYFNFR